MNEDKIYTGEVIWFNPESGFGFIDWEGKDDIFVHFSGIVKEGFKTLKKGDKVVFGVGQNNKGEPIAVEVVVTENAE